MLLSGREVPATAIFPVPQQTHQLCVVSQAVVANAESEDHDLFVCISDRSRGGGVMIIWMLSFSFVFIFGL